MAKFDLLNFDGPDALARAAAAAFLDELSRATRSKPFYMALSGGRIASKFFSEITSQTLSRQLSFDPVHLFWADERCVPPEHADSNFRVAQELLIDPLRIPPGQVHRIPGELGAETAAQSADAELRAVTGCGKNQPVLDLVVLGMGEDGHVASLFPGDASKRSGMDEPAFRAIHHSPKPPPDRVTMSYGTIVAATQCWVLVSGAGKKLALSNARGGASGTPIGQVLLLRQQTRIFSDQPG